MRKSSKVSAIWEAIPSVANGASVKKWLRPLMLLAILSPGRIPAIGKDLIAQYDALSGGDKDEFRFALINARSRAEASSDFMGAVAIPIIIGGFLAVDASGETALIKVLFCLCGLLLYMFIYLYYRNTQALINSCVEVIELKRQ